MNKGLLILYKFLLIFFTCTLIVVLSRSVQAQEINIDKWIVNVAAYQTTDSMDVYLRSNDSTESGAIIVIPKSPYIKGLSSVVLVKSGKETFGFVAGKLCSPGNKLIIIEMQIQNGEKKKRLLNVGDFKLVSNSGQNLPFVAVSKGESYLVAKSTEVAWKSSQEIKLSFEPDENIKMTYCFIVPPKSISVQLMIGKTKTSFIKECDKLNKYTILSPAMMELAGQFDLSMNIEVQGVDGTLSHQDSDLMFKSDVKYPKGVPLAAYTSNSSARSINQKKIFEKLNGKESTRSLSDLYMFQSGAYLAGQITFLYDIKPFEVYANYGELKLRFLFKSTFQASKGDILAAIGQVSDASTVLSTKVLE